MLTLSFLVLSGAVALGMLLAVLHMRAGEGTPPRWLRGWTLGAVHGGLGALGFLILLLALRAATGAEDRAAAHFGTSAFGLDAAVLLGAALLGGLAIAVTAWRRRKVPDLLLVLHGIVAVIGYVILAAFVS